MTENEGGFAAAVLPDEPRARLRGRPSGLMRTSGSVIGQTRYR
ncbi:hypothetical protein LAUMK13_03434 [Mycobacterium innocens]|uniref:Uncharacterized protein n=1 Tax=Mycobacterium innocens TaxID=2341083 RepID=A0A498Q880_9MYCO|nr:hypothetical protein LAUMK13_03434 [Mycobacterium innocens]